MKSGLDLTGVNPNIRPQDDLYLHVNGAWMDSAEIPSDRPSDGAFYRLRDQSEANIREIIEESAKANSTPGSEAPSHFWYRDWWSFLCYVAGLAINRCEYFWIKSHYWLGHRSRNRLFAIDCKPVQGRTSCWGIN